MLARIITSLGGAVLVIYGVIAAISPLPVGIPLAIIGLFMLAGANPALRPAIRWLRRKWPWFDKMTKFAAPRAGRSIRTVIEETAPNGHNDDQDGKVTRERQGQ